MARYSYTNLGKFIESGEKVVQHFNQFLGRIGRGYCSESDYVCVQDAENWMVMQIDRRHVVQIAESSDLLPKVIPLTLECINKWKQNTENPMHVCYISPIQPSEKKCMYFLQTVNC